RCRAQAHGKVGEIHTCPASRGRRRSPRCRRRHPLAFCCQRPRLCEDHQGHRWVHVRAVRRGDPRSAEAGDGGPAPLSRG
ncbi:hypothetical protein BN1708_020486, partial [Verticillium longisporum]